MKDYFHILGVEKDASDDEIRKAYRGLAMQFHPDRNPDDPQTEERFKEVAEAYGVLSDPKKRGEYERFCFSGAGQAGGAGFNYSQEEILRDLFKDPRFQQMLQRLLADFARSGFRMGPHFLKKAFFGGGKGMIMGGIFFLGSMAGPSLLGSKGKGAKLGGSAILKGIGRAVHGFLGGAEKSAVVDKQGNENDVTYHLCLSAAELQDGKWVQVQVPEGHDHKSLRIHIPPHSRGGQRLRVKGKGEFSSHGPGDLFLHLVEE